MTEKSVLLVEDNPDDIALAERALRRSGVSVRLEVATSGKDAWTSVHKNAPDALFLDLNMPGWNGFELLRRLREDETTRHVPVIILTTSKEPSDISRCYELGANSYVSKPVDFVQFSALFGEMVKYWLNINLTG